MNERAAEEGSTVMGADAPKATASAALPDERLTEALQTAVAICVAPERTDDVVGHMEPERLVAFIWTCDELIRRLNAARKGALIEAVGAQSRGELLENTIVVGGHRHVLKQDERADWQDIPGLLYGLNRMGLSVSDIAAAVNGLRVTDLRAAASKIEDADIREDALATIEDHRKRVPTQITLVDIDNVYRRGR